MACAFRFSRELGLLRARTPRGSRPICRASGLPTRIQESRAFEDAGGHSGRDAPGQEGRAGQADLHPCQEASARASSRGTSMRQASWHFLAGGTWHLFRLASATRRFRTCRHAKIALMPITSRRHRHRGQRCRRGVFRRRRDGADRRFTGAHACARDGGRQAGEAGQRISSACAAGSSARCCSAVSSSPSAPRRSPRASCSASTATAGVWAATIVMTTLIVVFRRGDAQDHRHRLSGPCLAFHRPFGAVLRHRFRSDRERGRSFWCGASCVCAACR